MDLLEFKDCLVYIENSRTARTTQENLCLRKQKQSKAKSLEETVESSGDWWQAQLRFRLLPARLE